MEQWATCLSVLYSATLKLARDAKNYRNLYRGLNQSQMELPSTLAGAGRPQRSPAKATTTFSHSSTDCPSREGCVQHHALGQTSGAHEAHEFLPCPLEHGLLHF